MAVGVLTGVITVVLVKEAVWEIPRVAVKGDSEVTIAVITSEATMLTGSIVGSGVNVAVGGSGVKVEVGVFVSVAVDVAVGVAVEVEVDVDVGVDVSVDVAEAVGVAVAALVGVLVAVGVDIAALNPSTWLTLRIATTSTVTAKPTIIPTRIFSVCESNLENSKFVVSGKKINLLWNPVYIFFNPAKAVGPIMLDHTIYGPVKSKMATFIGPIRFHIPNGPFTITVRNKGNFRAIG